MSEKLVYISLPLFSALLTGLLLQHTLDASVRFASCNRSDPSVLVAGKSLSRTETLANTDTQLEKKTACEEQWNLFCHLHCYATQGRKHLLGPLPLLLLEHPANIKWFDVKVSVNHTYQELPAQV